MKETQEVYVLTQDSPAIFERINQNGKLSDDFLVACDTYFAALQETLRSGFGNAIDVVGYRETDISRRLAEAVRQELISDPNTYCICLDRYFGREVENKFSDRFFRFSITRTLNGQKVPRSGDRFFAEQIQEFLDKNPSFAEKEGIIVDDGIFSGGTIQDTIALFRTAGVSLRIKSVIGFMGPSSANQDNTRILEPVMNLYDWIDIRDFSPFGGKTFLTSRNNKVATTVPYLYPWSYGEGASFNVLPSLFTISKRMIQNFQTLVLTFEKKEYGQRLRFRDLVKVGFPLPVSTTKTSIPISINDSVVEYLDRCINALEVERQRPVFIFDMDGTLYRLDGKNNGYSGSTLEQAVRDNALSFVKQRESCTAEQAQIIYNEGVSDPIGLSQYLAQRYGITRQMYFDEVWDIDPKPIIGEYEIPVAVMGELKRKPENKLVLLTSAPSTWAKRVLEMLGLEKTFELVFTGEQFGTKEEIFQRLSGWYNPATITSIGDQVKTDILPAKQCGFQTLLVSSPGDMKKLINSV